MATSFLTFSIRLCEAAISSQRCLILRRVSSLNNWEVSIKGSKGVKLTPLSLSKMARKLEIRVEVLDFGKQGLRGFEKKQRNRPYRHSFAKGSESGLV